MDRQPRTPQRVARRRGEILDTARRLFTEEGIGPVSTGRIAEAAGISPGNLYYWFPSKTAIVRSLFEEWSAESRIEVDRSDDPALILAALWGRAAAQERVSEGYAFFARELFGLLHADPVLAEAYRANYEARVGQLVALVERVIDAGLLQAPEPRSALPDLIRMLWLVSETAAPFAEVVPGAGFDAREATRAVIRPLLTPTGRTELGVA